MVGMNRNRNCYSELVADCVYDPGYVPEIYRAICIRATFGLGYFYNAMAMAWPLLSMA
jgi:hypothetical protein